MLHVTFHLTPPFFTECGAWVLVHATPPPFGAAAQKEGPGCVVRLGMNSPLSCPLAPEGLGLGTMGATAVPLEGRLPFCPRSASKQQA